MRCVYCCRCWEGKQKKPSGNKRTRSGIKDRWINTFSPVLKQSRQVYDPESRAGPHSRWLKQANAYRCSLCPEVSTRTISCVLCSSARYHLQFLFSSAQFGKPPAAFPRYERFEAEPDERGFFLDAGQLCCLGEQFIFDIQGCSHETRSSENMYYNDALICINCTYKRSRMIRYRGQLVVKPVEQIGGQGNPAKQRCPKPAHENIVIPEQPGPGMSRDKAPKNKFKGNGQNEPK